MIKAYHQVGSDEWDPEELRDGLAEVLSQGRIEPASMRMDRHEMEVECFSGKSRGGTLRQKFPKGDPKVWKALEQLAREKIEALPDSGFTHGLFNCLDLIAGDFDFIFMRPGGWYSVDNGFVFDAEQLLKKGAYYRQSDLLRGYHVAVEGVLKDRHDSVDAAREDLELELGAIQDHFQSTGREAIRSLRQGAGPNAEIVWRGPLPLDLAIEVWENGKDITKKVKRG